MNKHNKLEAVLFDVDGTLADTEQNGHRLAFNAAFEHFKLDWDWDIDLYGELLQVTGGKERIQHYIEKYHSAEFNNGDLSSWIASLHKTKNQYYQLLVEQGRILLRPGIARLIHELREEKIRIAIATTTPRESVTTLLKSTLGEESIHWFDVIGAGDIVPLKKPAPDIYYWVLSQLQLNAQQCIAIEDSENGLKSALAANIPTLITVNNYTCSQEFNGAVAVLSDLGEPTQPFTYIKGTVFEKQWVDYEVLNKLFLDY